MGTKNSDIQIKSIINKFPLKFSDDITLCLLDENIEIIYVEKNKCRKYKLNVIDNEGYKYKVDYHNTVSTIGKLRNPNRFFYNNPYTYNNINWFCKCNNIDLHIDTDGLPLSGYAREKLNMVNSCGDIKQVSWNQLQHYTFQYQLGYESTKKKRRSERELSKQDVIKIILKMQDKKDSPLDIYDFYPKQKNGVGIRTVRKFWGELWLMQKDLGLKITGKHGTILSDEDTLNEIKYICDMVNKNENRKTVTYRDFIELGTYSDCKKYAKVCKKNKGCSLREYVCLLGYELQKSGNGMNYKFSDGEITTSLYEYDFSSFLRNYGFIYNKNYFRDIYYKKLDSEYCGNMNCDYKIILDGHVVYIELAGILGNSEHMAAYRDNVPIKSKSKELYRQKLNQKREIFERNNLDYYILLPDEMNENSYKKIINTYLKEVA